MTPCQRVGILYSPWHWPAYTAQQIIEAKGGTPLNMEMILNSRLELGMLAFSTVHSPCKPSIIAASDEMAQHLAFRITQGVGFVAAQADA